MKVVSTIIFVAVLVASAGVFVFKLSLQQKVSGQEASLIAIQESFNPELINEALRLNFRIESVKKLLAEHTAPSQIFELFEDTTLLTVQFEQLDYITEEDGIVRIKIDGVADSFESVVLQSDSYGDTGYLRDVLFSGLEPNEEGNIDFNLEGVVENELILYRNSLVPVSSSSSNN